jgi:hypothetical protein
MCNYCECENYDKCSIVGHIPLGFCCPKCNFYDGEHSCLNSKMKTQDRIKSITDKIEALRNAFAKKDEKEQEQELEKFP